MISKRLATSLLLSGLLAAAPALAQSALAQQSTTQPSTKTAATKSTPATKPTSSKSATSVPAATVAKKSPPKTFVYIEDNTSSKASEASPSEKPQSTAVMRAFQQNCPSVEVTDNKVKAGYQVTYEREPGSKGVKSAFGLTNVVRKTNKIEVMSKGGKSLFSETGHSTSQLVKDACTAIGTPGTKIAKK